MGVLAPAVTRGCTVWPNGSRAWSIEGVTPSGSTIRHLLHRTRAARRFLVAGTTARSRVERTDAVVVAELQPEQHVALVEGPILLAGDACDRYVETVGNHCGHLGPLILRGVVRHPLASGASDYQNAGETAQSVHTTQHGTGLIASESDFQERIGGRGKA